MPPLCFADFNSILMRLPNSAATESVEDEVGIEPKRRKIQHTDSEEYLARGDSKMCFRVLSTGAGRMEHIGHFIRSSGAAKLASSDIAVTLHPELCDSAECQLKVALKPKRVTRTIIKILYGFDGFASFEQLQTSCMGWNDPDRAV